MAHDSAGGVPQASMALTLAARGEGFVLMRVAILVPAPPIVLRAMRFGEIVAASLRAPENPDLALPQSAREPTVVLEPGYIEVLSETAGPVVASAMARAVAAIAAQPRLHLPEAPGAAAALLKAARDASNPATSRERMRAATAAELHRALYFTLRHADRTGLLDDPGQEAARQ